MKPAVVRFYFDADVLGVGRLIAGLRSDCTYPGDPGATVHKRARPACPVISPTEDDEAWIPIVARHSWLIITRDRHIQSRPAQLAAIRSNAGRMVVLSSPDARGVWEQLEVLMTRWRDIERLTDLPAPLIYTVSRSSLRKVL